MGALTPSIGLCGSTRWLAINKPVGGLAKAGSIPLPVSIPLDEVGGEAGSYQRRFGKATPAIGLTRD